MSLYNYQVPSLTSEVNLIYTIDYNCNLFNIVKAFKSSTYFDRRIETKIQAVDFESKYKHSMLYGLIDDLSFWNVDKSISFISSKDKHQFFGSER